MQEIFVNLICINGTPVNTEQNKRQRIPKGQSKKENLEKLAAYCTQDQGKQKQKHTQYVLDTYM